MNSNLTNPRFEFRVFGHDVGSAVAAFKASLPSETSDESAHTYILSATNQHYNIKIRGDKLDVKVLLREYQGLERWYPYYQFAFPLTSAFLHEFLFAWLEIELPLLRRCHYTAHQFLQELMIPNPHLRTVEVCKKRRHHSVNNCQVEIGSLLVDEHYSTQTVAVEGADAEDVLQTVELLGLQAFTNTNYIVGLHQLLGQAPSQSWVPPLRAERFVPLLARQPVFHC